MPRPYYLVWVGATYHAGLFMPIVNTGTVFLFAWLPFNAYEVHAPRQFVSNVCGVVGVLVFLMVSVLIHDLVVLVCWGLGVVV